MSTNKSKQEFYDACRMGNFKNVDITEFDQSTINAGFRLACYEGQLQVVKSLISMGANDFSGSIYAIVNKKFNVVKYLISQNKCNLTCLDEDEAYNLLELGVCIDVFFCHKKLLDEIETFKTRAFIVIKNVLIPDLSMMIVDYSLK